MLLTEATEVPEGDWVVVSRTGSDRSWRSRRCAVLVRASRVVARFPGARLNFVWPRTRTFRFAPFELAIALAVARLSVPLHPLTGDAGHETFRVRNAVPPSVFFPTVIEA
jgi:hypothetical protein